MKRITLFTLSFIFLQWMGMATGHAQNRQREMYGDSTKEVRMHYVHSLEKARSLAYQQKKLIFINCHADWAAPCLGMNQYVFSDEDFARYMDKYFINLFVDMNSEEGKNIARRYGVTNYAHYLIINYKGELIQRISGGSKLPEFKEKVNLALNAKTSLAGTRKKHESGKYSKKDLYNYLRALDVAGEDSLFKTLGEEYMAMLDVKEYAEKKNWIFARLNKKRTGEYYRYLIANKPLFVKETGRKTVDNYIELLFSSEILGYATGDVEYDADKLNKINKEMTEADLTDTCATRIVYGIAQLRGQRKFCDLLEYMEQNARYLEPYRGIRAHIELSFNFPDMTNAEKAKVIDYLCNAAGRETGNNSNRLAKLAEVIKNGESGIIFEHTAFRDVLQKAQMQGKFVFVDCYTSWCGPCRSMANNVFTRTDVGSYFNAHFINVKVDMEKGEGIELAKKYQVKAFPTLLFLNADGQVLQQAVGYKSPEQLLEIARSVRDKH